MRPVKSPCLALLGLIASPAAAQYGPNLVVNGSAESYTYVDSAHEVADFTGWVRAGSVNATTYSAYPVTPIGMAPSSLGAVYFGGGTPAPPQDGTAFVTSVTQLIGLSAAQVGQIDAGGTSYQLQGYVGSERRNRPGVEDLVAVTATFLSATSAALGSRTIGVTQAEVSAYVSVRSATFKTATGALPAGTRSVRIDVAFTRNSGTVSNGSADNLAFAVTPVPEPASFAALGLGGLAILRRRKRA